MMIFLLYSCTLTIALNTLSIMQGLHAKYKIFISVYKMNNLTLIRNILSLLCLKQVQKE